MARSLKFSLGGEEISAPIEKLDRSKIYGRVEKKYYDRDGDECYFGSLSSDGISIFGKESFEMGYLTNEGEWRERKELVAVDWDNQLLEQKESSFKHSIALGETVSIDEFMQHVAKSVYQIDSPALLEAVKKNTESVFCFPFNYNASYSPDKAFLVENEDTLFMIIAQETGFDFIEAHQVESVILPDEEDEDDDEDIDFSMF